MFCVQGIANDIYFIPSTNQNRVKPSQIVWPHTLLEMQQVGGPINTDRRSVYSIGPRKCLKLQTSNWHSTVHHTTPNPMRLAYLRESSIWLHWEKAEGQLLLCHEQLVARAGCLKSGWVVAGFPSPVSPHVLVSLAPPCSGALALGLCSFWGGFLVLWPPAWGPASVVPCSPRTSYIALLLNKVVIQGQINVLQVMKV